MCKELSVKAQRETLVAGEVARERKEVDHNGPCMIQSFSSGTFLAYVM